MGIVCLKLKVPNVESLCKKGKLESPEIKPTSYNH